MNLCKFVDHEIGLILHGLIKVQGMNRFMSHEPLANGLFNRDMCTASSTMTAWSDCLTNTPAVLGLVCDRLEGDFLAQRPQMRKPYTARDVVPLMQTLLFRAHVETE
ncbi:unnamed protein product [Symbiodinium pilosum]|uniref:Uncharacterized protein n=1 Tax=Symbiodinium pilosum TaxID=2952 RepID=A0A812L2E4_SYMPI|nr:unnamed protein product [Symbiodinium pilosum]